MAKRRRKEPSWEQRMVPEWRGKMPRIFIEGNELQGYVGKILWNNKQIGDTISYSRHGIVYSACKRKRIIYMNMILEGKI